MRALTAGVLLLAGSLGDLKADWISEWNQYAVNAARDSDQLSPEVSRSMAMLNTAIYNAVEGIAGNYNLYACDSYTGPSGTAVSGASMQAAASAAAYTVLADLYPSMAGAFATQYSNQLSSLADDQARLDGINFGTLVANDILNWRASDGSGDASNPALYSPVGSVGYWAETSSNSASLPGWGSVATFGISGTAAYNGSLGMSNPTYLTTAAYAADYNNVKVMGEIAATGTVRTQDQEDAAFFWNGAPGTVTNVGLWNAVAEGIIASQSLSLADSARLYAALNVALADASIVAWDTKFEVDFWSPVTAINNGSADGNPATIGDGGWNPLIASPDVPSYFAEQAILGAAAVGILESFAGTNYAFMLDSDTDGDGFANFSFNFSSLAAALEQASDSVVWAGTNFETAATDGAIAGDAIAGAVLGNHFAAVPEPAGALLLVIAGMVSLGRRRR
jgi:hypothetical protein